MFTIELSQAAYDLVIIGKLCHLFDENSNRRLLIKARRHAAAQRHLAVIDVIPDAKRTAAR